MSRVSTFVCLCSALVLLALSLGQNPAYAATEAYCRKSALQELVSRGIRPEDVQSISVVQTRQTGLGEGTQRNARNVFNRDDPRQRSGALVRLKSCTGTIAVTMDQNCSPVRIDTRGDCKVPGLAEDQDDQPSWWPFKD